MPNATVDVRHCMEFLVQTLTMGTCEYKNCVCNEDTKNTIFHIYGSNCLLVIDKHNLYQSNQIKSFIWQHTHIHIIQLYKYNVDIIILIIYMNYCIKYEYIARALFGL